MRNWSDLIAPVMALAGLLITRFYPKFNYLDEALVHIPNNKTPESEVDIDHLAESMKNLVQGWQASVDLLYATFATVAVLFTRLATGQFNLTNSWCVLPLLLVLLVCDTALFYYARKFGPLKLAALHVPTLFLGRDSWFTRIQNFFWCSNLLLIGAIFLETIF